MNPNGMGGMPTGMGMMGMMPNGQMNPNMVRPGAPQGMPAQNGYQAMQQLLLKQFHTMDKTSLPQGWQQTCNPTERVKHVTELVTMLRTMSPQQDLNQVLALARSLEDKLFRESPTKDNYNQNMSQRKQQLQHKRQANAANLTQGLQQNPHMMGPQQPMFAQPGQGPMQMPNNMQNHFGPRFNPQAPRQGQVPDGQQMGPQFPGQMPGNGMPNMHPGMGVGQPPNMGQQQQQLSPQEQHQVQLLAQKMMTQMPQEQVPMIRSNVLRSMSPQQRMQLGNTNADPAIIWFKQQALKTYLQHKRNAQQGHPQQQPTPNMQFNPNMPHPNAPGGPAFDNSNNFDFFEKQRNNAEIAGRSGELVVPGNPMQRPPSNAGMRPGMPNMGNGFINPNQANAQNQPRPGQQPGPSPHLVGAGINTTSGPGTASTPSMAHLNQPFNTNVPSPSMPPNMTPNPNQANPQQQPQMRMPTAQEVAQLRQELLQLPQQLRDNLQQKPLQHQFLFMQNLKQKRAQQENLRNNGGMQINVPGNQQVVQPPQQTPNQPAKMPNQPNQAQSQVQLNPDQERKMDEFPFPLELVKKLLPSLPDGIRKWGQLKQFATARRLPPQIHQQIQRLQIFHFSQMSKRGQPGQAGAGQPGQPGQPGQQAQNVSGANNAAAAASNGGNQFLSDAHCEHVRSKNPTMANMSNDDIRKRWAHAQMQKKMQLQQQQQQQQQQQPQQQPQPSQQSVNPNVPKTAQPTPSQPPQNKPQNQPQQTAQPGQNQAQKAKSTGQNQPPKQPVKKESNDDVVEVPNPNLPPKSKAVQPPQRNQQPTIVGPTNAGSSQAASQKSIPSLAHATISLETVNKYKTWRNDVGTRLPPQSYAEYTQHQRSSVDVVLMGSAKMLTQIDSVLMQYLQHIIPDKPEDQKETEMKQLIQTSLLVKRQYDYSNPKDPKVADRLTMNYITLASSLTRLKSAFMKVAAMRNPRAQDQPGGQSAQPGQSVESQTRPEASVAPVAPMVKQVEAQRKPSTKRPARDQPPPAPTDDKQNPFSQTGGGVPKYADPQPFNRELQLPNKKRKNNQGTPVPSPPTGSPQINKSPHAKPVAQPLKCRRENCPNGKATFATKEDLQKHLDTAHEEPMPADPLEYALTHMRTAWNLDEEGKSKNAAVRMEKSASRQSPTSQAKSLGPGGVAMNRAVTSGNSNAPRTPQSISTVGSSSKPATPAMQAGKLPGKTQAPPTPPQDLWAGCPITAQSLAEILPTPVPSSSLASLTPDSKTSPDATDKPADKGTASPKTPKAADLMNLDNIQVKDVGVAEAKPDGMEFDFDFGGGMGPYESGMFGTADALSGGAFGGGLEELFGGDIALGGNTSWDDMMMYDAKPTGTAAKDVKSKPASGMKTPVPGKAKQEPEDAWATAFEMAWDD